MSETLPHVVIIGGGFGGLATAKALRRAPVRVTLVDRSNHHLFQPLLYQVATAALTAPDIASPLRRLLRWQDNTRVLMAEVVSIDVAAQRVVLDYGELEYDFLVLATGMKNNYFGHDEWEDHAPGLKTLSEALDIRARMLRAFEVAEREPDAERKKELLTFVVIGGGPTGVEMAGAFAEIARLTMVRDFKGIDPVKDTRVVLIEGGPRVLPTFSEESSRAATKDLEELGVEVVTGAFVTDVTDRCVKAGSDIEVQASTVIWAAGLKASSLTRWLGAELDRTGRVKVAPDLTVPGRPNIYVLGDLIHLEQDGELLPGVAQTALQSGRFAGKQITNELYGYPKKERFRYKDKGSMATIGRARAVAEVGESRFDGLLAYLLWALIHITFLVDFRNRIVVMLEWAWSYVTFRRSARVIVEAPARHRPAPDRSALLRSALTRPPLTDPSPPSQQPG